ncbi:MAG TPA: VWA domain-containing protein [Actinopolymorphaceae bacterium]|jgi:Ca-activated chloride channel family protein
MSAIRVWRSIIALCLTILVVSGPAVGSVAAAGTTKRHPQVGRADDGEVRPGSLLLLLDSSGSMKEPDASGTSKIEAAKQALTTVIDDLPTDMSVGLRVYGATIFDKSNPKACSDSQLVVPIGPADKPALKRAIKKYRPWGETPIAYSLRQAAKDLGSEGKRTILLVSDGEETCDPDPCVVARDIHAKGIDLRIDVVGLHVDARTKRQLACIADAGGGTYYDAQDADDLAASLDQSALRSFKDFQVSGTPIEGGLQPSEAPEIGAGQYTDTLAPAGAQTGRIKYYMLTRTPGATLHAALTARPKTRAGSAASSEEITLRLLTPSGDEECTWGHGAAFEWSSDRDFLNASVFLGPEGNSSASQYLADECTESDRLLLKVERDESGPGTGPEDPVELLVIEEPPVENLSELPPAVEDSDLTSKALPSGSSQGTVEGGGSFSDAITLTPGTWTSTLQPGEQLFYRVRVDWGQTASVTFRLPTNPQLASLVGGPGCGEKIELRAYAPDRAELFLPGGSDRNATSTTRCYRSDDYLHATLPQVRFRNREDGGGESIQPASLAGYYYFAIQQNQDSSGRKFQEEFEVTVAVNGEPSGVPEYREPSPQAQPAKEERGASSQDKSHNAQPPVNSSPGSRSDTLVPVALAGGTGLVVFAGGVVLAVLLIRRRPATAKVHPGASPTPPHQGYQQPPDRPGEPGRPPW